MGLDVQVIYAKQHLCYSEIKYIVGSLNSTIYKLDKSIGENLMDFFPPYAQFMNDTCCIININLL